MNKKIISILIIFSLLAVSLTSISANDTNVDEQNIADIQTETQESSQIEESTTTSENKTTTENVTDNDTEPGAYPDVVVPTDTSKLENFNILMNFVTPEGLNYFADQLAQIDEESFKDVITVLRNDDREHILPTLGELSQDKIDLFFDEFLKLFDTTYQQETNNNNNNPTNIISNTVSQIFGSGQNSESNIPANNFIKVNPKNTNNQPSQNNPQLSYNGQYYSLIDFVKLLKTSYENGNITFDEFLQALEDNGIDTSDIKVENGVIQWGLLYIIPGDVDIADNVNNTTVDNETINTTSEDNNSSASNSESSSSSSSETTEVTPTEGSTNSAE